jgi:signal transduction histidine kinase
MLQEFLVRNRTLLIDRCRLMVAERSQSKLIANELAHGIPIFLDQLVETLTRGPLSFRSGSASSNKGTLESEVGDMAALHGRDLLAQGFTLEQVVRDYGDVCQAVTNLAFETNAPIDVDEFRTFNRCLDNAIAGAVTEYARHSVVPIENESPKISNSRLGVLAHELRNHLQTMTLVINAIKSGKIGISGATGGVLDRSIVGMRKLIDQSLANVRLNAGLAPQFQLIHLGKFLCDIEVSAVLDARARGLRFTVTPIDADIAVYADPDMLSSAVGNLLQNAFKFTKPHTGVRLHARSVAGRVHIEIEDQCGGLPGGAVDTLFLPFVQSGENRSGLGLGLDICRRSVEANGGLVTVRDEPGSGCVFTIDLPRHVNF